jgi:DNA damage-binding protein 1
VSGALHCGLTEFFNVKSMHDFATSEKRREQWEFDNYPEGEVQEMIELYMSMGFAHHDAANVINIMAKHPSFFVNHMMVEELGMLPPDPHTRPAHDGSSLLSMY